VSEGAILFPSPLSPPPPPLFVGVTPLAGGLESHKLAVCGAGRLNYLLRTLEVSSVSVVSPEPAWIRAWKREGEEGGGGRGGEQLVCEVWVGFPNDLIPVSAERLTV